MESFQLCSIALWSRRECSTLQLSTLPSSSTVGTYVNTLVVKLPSAETYNKNKIYIY